MWVPTGISRSRIEKLDQALIHSLYCHINVKGDASAEQRSNILTEFPVNLLGVKICSEFVKDTRFLAPLIGHACVDDTRFIHRHLRECVIEIDRFRPFLR